MAASEFMVPVSVGEVVDKITILRIKAERIKDPAKLANIDKELSVLDQAYQAAYAPISAEVEALTADLQGVNEALWDIEDDIRDQERAQDFGARFIELARAVYFTNDRRAAIKKDINLALGSALIEEKSYADYSAQAAN